jgi:SAM-dependent methyltransferase
MLLAKSLPYNEQAMKRNPLLEKILKRKFVAPMAARLQGFEQWAKTPTGQAIFAKQKNLLEQKLETLFGYHLMQISAVGRCDFLQSSKIRHKFSVSRRQDLAADLYCDEQALALRSDSIDVAVLHHVLDYSKDPHKLLREVTRVVLPSGHIVIVGFNPKSLFLPNMLLSRLFNKPVWQTQLLSADRLADWLTLLGFTVESVDYAYYRLPVRHRFAASLLDRIEQLCSRYQLGGGAFYLILARKDVSTITPIKPKRKALVKPVIAPVKPTVYQGNKKKDAKH